MEEKELFSHVDEIGQERLKGILKSLPVETLAKETETSRVRKIHPQYVILILFVIFTLSAELIFPGDPAYMALSEKNIAPGRRFWFGTDALGRDIFGMVIHGGRISLLVGLLSTLISTGMGLMVGSLSALLPEFFGKMAARVTELFLSVPSILLMIFIQSVMKGNPVVSISLSIGLSSWMTLAKMMHVRILEIRNEEYVRLARYLGGGYFYMMRRHYLPSVVPVLFCMAFSGFGHAVLAEATLSFLGIGFPVGTVTWGGLLNLSGQALMTKSWWVIIIPGIFLVTSVSALMETGEIMRRKYGTAKHL
ncbi:ABC transporter permease [Proteiniclasticum sp.]|uniref:ABC transporter permease n=1 Tax=Proteiniclasticum sp. TaxID=2053595 RepID=UPI0028A0A4E3|nr:ABC transporter permease [Proteiniclasticum sp.]